VTAPVAGKKIPNPKSPTVKRRMFHVDVQPIMKVTTAFGPLIVWICVCITFVCGSHAAIEVDFSQSYFYNEDFEYLAFADGLGETNLAANRFECYSTSSNKICATWSGQQWSRFELTTTGLTVAVSTNMRATNSSASDQRFVIWSTAGCRFRVDGQVDYTLEVSLSPRFGSVSLDTSNKTIHFLTCRTDGDCNFVLSGKLDPGRYYFGMGATISRTNEFLTAETSLMAKLTVSSPANGTPPMLDVTRRGTNLVLRWTNNALYQLQAVAELAASGETTWTNVVGNPPLLWPPTQAACFFRLTRRQVPDN
jgi:hypothetical protein